MFQDQVCANKILQELNRKRFRCKTSKLSRGLNWWQMLHRGCGFLTFGRVMRLCHEEYTVERLQMGAEAFAEIPEDFHADKY